MKKIYLKAFDFHHKWHDAICLYNVFRRQNPSKDNSDNDIEK